MGYKKTFQVKVEERLAKHAPSSLLTESDLSHLPAVVQKYLRYTGAVGKPGIHNFRAVFEGEMKLKENAGWMKIRSVQYNFYDDPARYFYISAKMMGVPVTGLHVYEQGHATMQIKAAGLVAVADAKGPVMDQGETVTVLNDMCFMAPATLANPGIYWKPLDEYRVIAEYSNSGIKVKVELRFNNLGQLVGFVSEDRSRSFDGKSYEQMPWSTPIGEYVEMEERMVPTYGEAVWHYPDREFCYGRFRVKEIAYNVKAFSF
jgi:hypothetical protein